MRWRGGGGGGGGWWWMVVWLSVAGVGCSWAWSLPGASCPHNCRCYINSDDERAANCSPAAFFPHGGHRTDPTVKALHVRPHQHGHPLKLFRRMFQLFKNIKFLDLSNCSVTALPDGVFAGLQYVVEIDLSYNDIERLDGDVFSGLGYLETLTLRGNPIGRISGYPVVSASLTELDLGYCGLRDIPAGAFRRVPALNSLYLDGNRLRTFGDVLPRKLVYLNLAGNRIVDVPEEIWNSLPDLKRLDLSENPINCTCGLFLFQDYFSGRGNVFENGIVCHLPPQYAGRRMSAINEDELCKYEYGSKDGHINNIRYPLEVAKRFRKHSGPYESSAMAVMADQPVWETDDSGDSGTGATDTYAETKTTEEDEEEDKLTGFDNTDSLEMDAIGNTDHYVEDLDSDAGSSNVTDPGESRSPIENEEEHGEEDIARTISLAKTTAHPETSKPWILMPDEETLVAKKSSIVSEENTLLDSGEYLTVQPINNTDVSDRPESGSPESSLPPRKSGFWTTDSTVGTVDGEKYGLDGGSGDGETSSETDNTPTSVATSSREELWEVKFTTAPSEQIKGTVSEEKYSTEMDGGSITEGTTTDETSRSSEVNPTTKPTDNTEFEFFKETTSEPPPTSLHGESVATETTLVDYSTEVPTETTIREGTPTEWEEETETTTQSEEYSGYSDGSTITESPDTETGSEETSEASTTVPTASETEGETTTVTVISEGDAETPTDGTTEETTETPEDTAEVTEQTTERIAETTEVTVVGPSVDTVETSPTTDDFTEETTTEAVEGTGVETVAEASSPQPVPEESTSTAPDTITPTLHVGDEKDDLSEETTTAEPETTTDAPIIPKTKGPDLSEEPAVLPQEESESDTEKPLEGAGGVTETSDSDEDVVGEEGTEAPDSNYTNEEFKGRKLDEKEGKEQSMGSYIVVGLIAVLVLGLIVLAVCRRKKTPTKIRLPNDAESNLGTEMQDMDSLLPKPPENGVKIVPKDYGEPNGEVKEEAQPVLHEENVSEVDKSEQNGGVQRATARLTVLPEPVLQTPVFLHKPYPDE